MITITASPWIQTNEQLELTTDALPEYHTPQDTLLENWLTLRAASKGLEESDHHSSRKEPNSGNDSTSKENNKISLPLTPIMYHQTNKDFSVHITGLNPRGTITEENQQEKMTSSSI